ncbi:hypothetical protein Veis_3229 [Verminephrobacter eiseniae EF01-2]|uniref:Uncharacterized protein n=1 Tax=Verminephrobacter eiseniae (strain EF01-2) TaxID=391735 RepID=A1WMV2_VEREI|nr:hypothetical protein Veis_3229 [Verminephrobacter eiseniae EF01-2]
MRSALSQVGATKIDRRRHEFVRGRQCRRYRLPAGHQRHPRPRRQRGEHPGRADSCARHRPVNDGEPAPGIGAAISLRCL